jgi:hypothetical protein
VGCVVEMGPVTADIAQGSNRSLLKSAPAGEAMSPQQTTGEVTALGG